MKATYIPVHPPKKLLELFGVSPNTNETQISLEPEVLAACLARYSRTNEGITSILQKYGDKSPSAIFKFIDYGHASIGGLTGAIAIAIDNVSMLAALKLFEFSQMADGQESSTRYIELQPESILSPNDIGINDPEIGKELTHCIRLGFEVYKTCLSLLEKNVLENPSIAKIPPETPEKTAQRMLKNYGLDRCRYFLPMCARTNLALVMSARSWAQTLKELDSLPWEETKKLSHLIRTELNKVAPDLIRHSFPDLASTTQTNLKISKAQTITKEKFQKGNASLPKTLSQNTRCITKTNIYGDCLAPWEEALNSDEELKNSFEGKENRYSCCGDAIKRMTTRATWSAMALAEIRDLNRHRTGFRTYHSIPVGFYLPKEVESLKETNQNVKELLTNFLNVYESLLQKVIESSTIPQYKDYFYFLGTQVPFEHTQQLDKFIYEAELRTGLGAHFRYAEHLKDATESLIQSMPAIEKFIKIGTAEPE